MAAKFYNDQTIRFRGEWEAPIMLNAHLIKIPGLGFGKDARFEVTAGGPAIGIINDTRSTFQLDNRSFSIARSGFVAPRLSLKSGDAVIATTKQKPFRNYHTLSFGGKEWTFKALDLLANRFGLFENETQTGTISPGPLLSRLEDITADLPDELPREVQMFLLSIFIAKLTEPST